MGGLLLAVLASPPVRADEPATKQADGATEQQADEATEQPADEATRQGREAYLRGVELARAQDWGEALAAFQLAAEARDAPRVQFNIAGCLRALGRYVAARQALRRALEKPEELGPTQREDAKAFTREIDALLVRLTVVLEPTSAQLSVDGRPLVPSPDDGGALLAGVAPAGDGVAPGKRELTLILDPGSHLFRAVRPGHEPALVRRSYGPGATDALELKLDVLPATVRIESTPTGAIVRVGAREVGVTPVEFQRPAGSYDLEVARDEFEPYTAVLDLEPGQSADLTAKLQPYDPPIYTRWWFWTGAAAIVATGVVLTYALTRPEPEPPPYDGGSTGWVVEPALFRF